MGKTPWVLDYDTASTVLLLVIPFRDGDVLRYTWLFHANYSSRYYLLMLFVLRTGTGGS